MKMTTRQLGLTLTEMLLALAIASLLLVTTLRVITAASRSSAASRAADEHAPSRTQLKILLRMDILHADSYRQTTDGIEMKLRSSLDKKTLGLKHEPSIVAYRVLKIDGRNWLIRTQRRGSEVWRELLAADVIKIAPDIPDILEPLLDLDTWGEVSGSFPLNILFIEMNELPMRVNCILK